MNLVSHTGQYIFGTGTGTARAIYAYAKGIENLSPQQADLIMQSYKRGSLGLGLLALGFFRPEMFGGYYDQDREKRKGPDEPKAGEAKVGGTAIPSAFLHHPLLQVGQFGATLRRAFDAAPREENVVEKGAGSFIASMFGLVKETPLVRETADVQKMEDSRQRGRFLGEYLKNLTVPQLVQWIARHTDTDRQGEEIRRKPSGVLQHLEEGVPVLRKGLAAK